MGEPVITNMAQALAGRILPSVTLWNRVEGRPRTHDFDRALRAEVRDPVWMLTRQWQMGEFRGEDAGSPVFAKIHVEVARFDGYRAGGPAGGGGGAASGARDPGAAPEAAAAAPGPFDWTVPLEARVERRPIPFEREGHLVSLDLRLVMGRHWLKLVREVGDFRDEYVALYPVRAPDPDDPADAPVCAHAESWRYAAAVAGRAMDGYALYRHIREGRPAHDGTSVPPGEHDRVEALGERFARWFEGLLYQPGAEDAAWQPDSLDYRFGVSAPDGGGAPVLEAEAYHHGDMDWYTVDVARGAGSLGGEGGGGPGDPGAGGPGSGDPADPPAVGPPGEAPPPTTTFLPVPLTFEGMPHTRWWTFEDARTNLGDVNPGTRDLAKLMLMEFGLVGATDWFLFPLTLPVGSTSRIRGLAVTNVFGERTWVEAAGRGAEQDWQRWSMFTLSAVGGEAGEADRRFALLPTAAKVQKSEPVEEIALIRDEMANMVWGIEARVPLPHGRSRPGYEAALDLRRFHEGRVAGGPQADPPPAAAPVRYTVMSNHVPENWIPLVPVHVPGDNRTIQLQRAALPRVIEGDPDPPVKIRPRTAVLGHGRSENAAYFIHEEEVPRAGTHLVQEYHRARWMGGRVVTWLGVRKETGRGEGASNLRFDYLKGVGG